MIFRRQIPFFLNYHINLPPLKSAFEIEFRSRIQLREHLSASLLFQLSVCESTHVSFVACIFQVPTLDLPSVFRGNKLASEILYKHSNVIIRVQIEWRIGSEWNFDCAWAKLIRVGCIKLLLFHEIEHDIWF